MKELSLNILDIAENSLSAGATRVEITLAEKPDGWLTLTVRDNGKGMEKETLTRLCDPFFTTRTTRRVGMGVPLLRLAAEQTGGTLRIESETGENHGTVVTANFQTLHIDCTPVGDTAATLVTLVQGHPAVDFCFLHETPRGAVFLDTAEIRAVLGADIPLSDPQILAFIGAELTRQYNEMK